MRYFIFFLMLIFFSSCFLMPLGAPHYHKYKSINQNEFVNTVEVFDTPRNKIYHFFAEKGLQVKGCSTVFKDTCAVFIYADFFEKKKYQKNIRMRDGKFQELLKNDTLKLFINDKKFLFIPVIN